LAAIAQLVVVLFVRALVVDENGPRRSEEIQFALAQSASAQTAPAGQIPTCEQLLSEFESDPETQQAPLPSDNSGWPFCRPSHRVSWTRVYQEHPNSAWTATA
jgi:hypothetical protein